MTSCSTSAGEATFRKVLATWPAYVTTHHVYVRQCDGYAYYGYVGNDNWLPETSGVTRLDINVRGDTLYLLGIRLLPELRGKGLGRKLYEVVEELARQLGCSRVVQTPSGRTYSGQSRADYLRKLGYSLSGHVATKELQKDG